MSVLDISSPQMSFTVVDDAYKSGLCLCCQPGTISLYQQPEQASGRDHNGQRMK